jgi:undecaprenyl-diphosphatase
LLDGERVKASDHSLMTDGETLDPAARFGNKALMKLIRTLLKRVEFPMLFAGIVIAGGLWGFLELTEVARDGAPHSLDSDILLFFRVEGHPDTPIGPPWLQGATRDITALGSASVLTLVTAATAIYLFLVRKWATGLFVIAAIASGQVLSSLLKAGVDRPRPELVSHLMQETSLSFPSGHAMISALAYLTLGALASRAVHGRTAKAYVLSLAVFVALLVGVSRIYLGVHWPSDVLAGWCAGFAWAMLWWLAARLLQQRRGEPEADE